MGRLISICLLVLVLCIPSYGQKGGGRSFSGGSSRSSSSSSSFRSSSGSKPSVSPPKISSSSPGSSLAKSRALQNSATQKSNYNQKSSAGSKTYSYAKPSTPSSNVSSNKSTTNRVANSSNNQTRNVRITNIYRGYPSTYNSYHYNDSFHPFLTGMLMGRLMDSGHHTETVRYIHDHWDEFDEARKQQLLRENATLKDELAQLNGTPRNQGSQLSGVDQDVTYHDNYVEQSTGFWWKFLCWTMALATIIGFIVIIFFIQWNI